VPQVHRNCPHNELLALCARVLAPLPPGVMLPLGTSVLRGFQRVRNVVRSYSGHRWSNRETAMTYQGLLRRRYLLAAESLNQDRVSWRDARLSCFLKAEKVNVLAKFQKPRMIFPRDPRYNLEVASRLKPFEHWLWGRLTARSLWGGDNVTRVVAKGLNPRQRGNLIFRKFNNFRECVVFEVDGRAFEAHVGPYHLEQEHLIYKTAYPGDRGLKWLLKQQESLRGRLPCGAKFSRPGGRASGDFNTGMGNSLLMLAICCGVLAEYQVPFDLLVDGDNALIFLERSTSGVVLADFADRVLLASGMEFTLERPVCLMEQVRFGRSAPIRLGGNRGWIMVREVVSVLSGALASHRYLREPKYAREWLTGVAMCELSLGLGIPMLQAWASSILNLTGFSGRIRSGPYREYFIQGAWLAGVEESREISPETRASFCAAFGFTPEQQVAWEERVVRAEAGRLDLSAVTAVKQFSDLQDCPPGLGESFLDSQF